MRIKNDQTIYLYEILGISKHTVGVQCKKTFNTVIESFPRKL